MLNICKTMRIQLHYGKYSGEITPYPPQKQIHATLAWLEPSCITVHKMFLLMVLSLMKHRPHLVPPGFVLGPVLFLLYINDISDNISSNMCLFADDSIIDHEIVSEDDHHRNRLESAHTKQYSETRQRSVQHCPLCVW